MIFRARPVFVRFVSVAKSLSVIGRWFLAFRVFALGVFECVSRPRRRQSSALKHVKSPSFELALAHLNH